MTGRYNILTDAEVSPEVFALRPDYRALLILADDLVPGPSDEISDKLLTEAEHRARAELGDGPVEEHPHVAQWRAAFRAFGAKPQRTRPSVEALLRRLPQPRTLSEGHAAGAQQGLPRIDRLTDAYNAVSIAHVVPLGGEDADRYQGSPRLVRAQGTEPFDTTADGEPVVEHAEAGEVIWRDDAGVTCRRWNWRQCTRTRLTTGTTRAVFFLDALDPMDDDALAAAGQALAEALLATSPQAHLTTRLLRRP